MPHTTPLLRFEFNWRRFPLPSTVPLIPIRFIYKDSSGQQKNTPLIYAVLDSGADAVTIPKDMADNWNLTLQQLPPNIGVNTASGKIPAFISKIDFLVGQAAARTVKYEDVEICVIQGCPAILVGIHPVFEDYDVTIKAEERRYVLEPRI